MKTQKELSQIRSRCFIKPYEGGDWQDLDEVVKGAITITEETPTPESINRTGTITFKFHCKVNPRWYEFFDAIDKLINAYKYRKHRKTTYKTLRHDCAKRNGRR